MRVRKYKWVHIYTFIFALGIIVWQLALIFDGKALIMSSDGVKQHLL